MKTGAGSWEPGMIGDAQGPLHAQAPLHRPLRQPNEAGLKRDIEVVRALAGAFPDSTLLVDSNDGHTPDDAIAFLKGIGDIRLLWFEEPFVETIDAWTRLHAWAKANGHGKMLLADGEQGNDYLVLEQLEADGILNVRLCDIMGYGFTRWRKLLPALLKTGTQASPPRPSRWTSAAMCCGTARCRCPTRRVSASPCGIEAGQWQQDGSSPAAGFASLTESPAGSGIVS